VRPVRIHHSWDTDLQSAVINVDYLHEASFGRGSISIRVVGG
jgi:hypothetical protein